MNCLRAHTFTNQGQAWLPEKLGHMERGGLCTVETFGCYTGKSACTVGGTSVGKANEYPNLKSILGLAP